MILINGEKMPADQIPELKKRAVFKLMGTYTRQEYDKKDKRYRQINAQSYTFPTVYNMYDEKRRETVQVRYALSETPTLGSDNKQFKKYMPHKIAFQPNGMRMVGPEENDLYWFMMNCPKRDKGDGKGSPSFYLDSPESTAKVKRNDALLEHTAVSMLIGPTKKSLYEQRRLIEALGLGDVNDMTDEMVTTVLISHAKTDPQTFLNKTSSAEINIKVILSGARKSNFIEYVIGNRKWVWGKAVPGSAARDIVVVPVSRDPEEYFIEWLLRTDNSGVLNEIQILVREVEEKRERAKAVEAKDTFVKNDGPIEVVDLGHGSPEAHKAPKADVPKTDGYVSRTGITQEMKDRAIAAGMPLQGVGTMKVETFMAKLAKAEADKEKRQLA